jgi:hypothetical protein
MLAALASLPHPIWKLRAAEVRCSKLAQQLEELKARLEAAVRAERETKLSYAKCEQDLLRCEWMN